MFNFVLLIFTVQFRHACLETTSISLLAQFHNKDLSEDSFNHENDDFLTMTKESMVQSESYCHQPGMKCNNPQGGICKRPTSNSKLICDCPISHTKVASSSRDVNAYVCQHKLLNIHCLRDHDFACLLVKDSVCNPAGGYCVCLIGYIYVPHRHQCKRQYLGNHAYCEYCRKEFGICFEEENMNMSNGPKMKSSSNDQMIRLSCACQLHKGISSNSLTDWKLPVCSVKLQDIDEECNNRDFQCRSKRAVCQKPRDKETDWQRCLCPQRFVAIYQRWLQYYECFEQMDPKSLGCERCSQSQSYGICYSINNGTSGSGCACPKRMSTPKGSKQYCSKHHVSVICGAGSMLVRFDPRYNEAPYDHLAERLLSNRALALIENDNIHDELNVCRLTLVGNIYQVLLNATGDGPCGVGRSIRILKRDYGKVRYEAKLKILYSHQYSSYHDIHVNLFCTVSHHPTQISNAISKKNFQMKRFFFKNEAQLTLRVLDAENRLTYEAMEDDLVRLDLELTDKTHFTSFMVEECFVSNKSRIVNKMINAIQIIQCGGLPLSASGFNKGFNEVEENWHYNTQLFKAFRLGGMPSVYFGCKLRICTRDESQLCYKSICSEPKKRNQDDTSMIEKEVHFIVIKNQFSVRQRTGNFCTTYSVCLTTTQMIAMIAVLFIIMILTCSLITVVYRRKLFFLTQQLTRSQTVENVKPLKYQRVSQSQEHEISTALIRCTDRLCENSSCQELQYSCFKFSPAEDAQNSDTDCGRCGGTLRRISEQPNPCVRCHSDRHDMCTCDSKFHVKQCLNSSQV